MGNFFTDRERKIIEMSHAVCQNALKSAAYELQMDVKNNICYRIVDEYYEEYDPTRYKRIHSLYDAWNMRAAIVGDRLHFYPDLDSDRMPEHYSRSKFHKSGDTWISRYDDGFDFDSDDNGRPENSWILDNFFKGIHPRFFARQGLIFDESYQYDGVLAKMGKYVNIYKRSGNMINILAKHLKKCTDILRQM